MTEPTPATLPATAGETTPERPWPVRHLSPKIADYIARLPAVWIEGQVLNARTWRDMVFLTLRDTDEQMSVSATLPKQAVDSLGSALSEGTRIVIHAKPQWWTKQGTVQMAGREVRRVGTGDLLARLEALKEALAAEGLFASERKVPLPFIPRVVGLVCATQGDAEHDVVENATRRWPAVTFEIRRVTVQGPRAVTEASAAIAALDAIEAVDVIVVARGGGSFEDLLAFSDERVIRAAAACVTPLVSAIGHEKDSPLLDLVADYRASTPTDAGKRIVPDAAAEKAGLNRARAAMTTALSARLTRESGALAAIRSRPVLARPLTVLDPLAGALDQWRAAARAATARTVTHAQAYTRELAATLRALSPHSTLARGFAVVRDATGTVVRDADAVVTGDALTVRVARGEFGAVVGPAN